MKDFEGRIAVVTGGGTGMGRELARQLSREGCHVAVADGTDPEVEEIHSREDVLFGVEDPERHGAVLLVAEEERPPSWPQP